MTSLLLAVALLRPQAPLDISALNQMATKRDVTGLSQLLDTPPSGISPFAVLKGGSYDVGKFGWKAEELAAVDGKTYVVFTTPLTSEDTGDLLFERSGDKLKFIPETDDMGILITHHGFDLRFDIPNKTAKLVDDATFHRSGAPGSAFIARFSPCYKVKSIKDASGVSVPFKQAAGVVSMATPPGSGDFHLMMAYEAVVDLYQYAGSVSDKEATLTNDYWYPMIARQPSTYDIAIHSPSSWIGLGQGELVDTQTSGAEKITKYHMALPVTYFSVSAAPYKTHSETVNGRRYSVWSLHMDDDRMKDQCLFYPPIIEFYDKTFGKFPFSGYGAVVSDAYGGGALEAYSFATYGGEPGEDGHEPAHTWFGGVLDNSYLHSFWNESFADYCDELYHRHSPIGDQPARELAFGSVPRYVGLWEQGNVEDSSVALGPAAGALGYGKGAYVLSMLEQELGTTTMLACMKQWVTDRPTDRCAEWAGFEAAVAKVTGKDYGWFWDEWLRRPGAADFDITDVKYDGTAVVGNVKFKGMPYKFTCEALLMAGSSRKIVKFQVDGNGPISMPSSDRPTLVSIDPYRKVLRKMNSDESPVAIERFRGKVFRDPAQPLFRPELKASLQSLPDDLNGITIVGSPATLRELKPLCAEAGFSVNGDTLTYKGTTVNLKEGTATAVLDLAGGGHCMIALGQSRWRPEPGHASVCLTDVMGRFLNGYTPPKMAGNLTYRIP